MSPIRRWFSARRCREDGVAATEAALVMPLFLALIVGTIELAFLMTARADVRSAASSAVREGSLAANSANADFAILKEIKGASRRQLSSIKWVIVFKANTQMNSAPPTACVTAAGSNLAGVSGVCNIYYPATIKNPVETTFGYDAANNPTATADKMWPARTRAATFSGGRDVVGVAISSSYKSMTGMFPVTNRVVSSVLELEGLSA